MKCYHCNENEADSRFYINFFGQTAEILLCQDCLAALEKYAGAIYDEFQREWKAAVPEEHHHHHHGEERARIHMQEEARAVPAEWDAGTTLRNRRQMNEMQKKLEDAVAREDYERAAELRDEIARKEKGVCIYDV